MDAEPEDQPEFRYGPTGDPNDLGAAALAAHDEWAAAMRETGKRVAAEREAARRALEEAAKARSAPAVVRAARAIRRRFSPGSSPDDAAADTAPTPEPTLHVEAVESDAPVQLPAYPSPVPPPSEPES